MEKEKIVGQCEGCEKIDGEYCSTYLSPSTKWRLGCPLHPSSVKNLLVEGKKKSRFAGKRVDKPEVGYRFNRGKTK